MAEIVITIGATAQTVAVPKIANIPWAFSENNETAVGTVNTTLKNIYNGCGLEWIDEGKVIAVWSQISKKTDANGLPTDEEMLSLGKKLGVDYVSAGKCDWKVKSIVQLSGLKTKADAVISLKIVNVKKALVEYEKKQVKADSQAKTNDLALAASLVVFLPSAYVSGGPKTPPMQKAGSVAVARALDDFYKAHTPAAEGQKPGRKIGVDKSGK